ncbi:MAG: sugar ABC transporter ATP-binding protein [Chthoniobacterales bacterium]
MSVPLLAADHLIKRFPGVIALNGVSFNLWGGEMHALCGENGAGKSTLIKTLSGIHPAGSYEGDILVEGKIVSFQNSKDAEKHGIGVIYQELALVPEMTVAENIFLGNEPRRRGGVFIDWEKIYRESKELLDRFGLSIDPAAKVNDLGIGHQQLVEIAKAMSKHTRVLILDEPTAALTEQEVGVLLDMLRDLKKRGIALVYISHKLDEVFAIADRITVLRDGKSITTLEAAQTTKSEVIRHMVGRPLEDLFPRRIGNIGQVILSVKDLTVAEGAKNRLEQISFEVRAGEVLGIGGLMGAGRSELLLHLFGAYGQRAGGEVLLENKALGPKHSPTESIRRGLVLVSEDRKRYGLILDQEIGFNMALSSLWDLVNRMCGSWGLIDAHKESGRNQEYFRSLQIKAPGLTTPVGTLSGGNQQKVVLAKAMMTRPKVVFLDEPTRGIDVGAKLEVYELVNKLTDAGQAVVLVSSELPELMGMSDRILMLAEGHTGGLFGQGEATQENLLAAAMGTVHTPNLN